MGENFNTKILEHEMKCQKDTTKDRHEFRDEIHKKMLTSDNKLDKTNDEVNNIKQNMALFNQTTKTMQESMDRMETKLDKFIDAANETYAKKGTVSLHSKILGFFIVTVVSSMGAFIWGQITTIIGK